MLDLYKQLMNTIIGILSFSVLIGGFLSGVSYAGLIDYEDEEISTLENEGTLTYENTDNYPVNFYISKIILGDYIRYETNIGNTAKRGYLLIRNHEKKGEDIQLIRFNLNQKPDCVYLVYTPPTEFSEHQFRNWELEERENLKFILDIAYELKVLVTLSNTIKNDIQTNNPLPAIAIDYFDDLVNEATEYIYKGEFDKARSLMTPFLRLDH